MKYIGKLYGKQAGIYFPLIATSQDIDKMEADLASTRRQLEIAVEALKYIDQYNRKSSNPNSFTVGDGLNMRGEAGLALDAINKIGPKIE